MSLYGTLNTQIYHISNCVVCDEENGRETFRLLVVSAVDGPMPNACRGGYKGLNAIRTRPSCGRLCSVFSTFLVGTFSKLASYWLRAFARRNGLGTRLV